LANWGYDISIDQNGRTGNKPILWNYANDTDRKALYNAYAKYIKMKLKNPVFGSSTVTSTLNGAVKNIAISGSGVDVQVVGNYDVVAQAATVNFTKTGTWYDYVSGTTLNVTNIATPVTLQPGEYHIYSSVKLQ
jgi:1,4-alpha-glucan branching enzyme